MIEKELDIVGVSPQQRHGSVAVECGFCKILKYVPKQYVVGQHINAERLVGAFLSPDKNLYCNRECWAKFCED